MTAGSGQSSAITSSRATGGGVVMLADATGVLRRFRRHRCRSNVSAPIRRIGRPSPGYETRVDLHFLSELTATPGPYASVYLDASHTTEDAAHTLPLRWAAARDELAGQGADDATLAALDDAFLGRPA